MYKNYTYWIWQKICSQFSALSFKQFKFINIKTKVSLNVDIRHNESAYTSCYKIVMVIDHEMFTMSCKNNGGFRWAAQCNKVMKSLLSYHWSYLIFVAEEISQNHHYFENYNEKGNGWKRSLSENAYILKDNIGNHYCTQTYYLYFRKRLIKS